MWIEAIKKGLIYSKRIIGAIMDPRDSAACPNCCEEVYYNRSLHEQDGTSKFFYSCECGKRFSKKYPKKYANLWPGIPRSTSKPVKTRPDQVSSVQKRYISSSDIDKKVLVCPGCDRSHYTEVIGKLQNKDVPCYDCWRFSIARKK